MPILKSFLKDGEAESYQNVQVKFVRGRKAVMTIYESDDDEGDGGEEGWVEKEQIVLSDYKTKEEMHALMIEKGFQLKSPEEIEAIQKQYKDEAEAERIRAEERREEMRLRREEQQRHMREEETMREEEARAAASAVDEGGGDDGSSSFSSGLDRDGSNNSDGSEKSEADSGAKDEL